MRWAGVMLNILVSAVPLMGIQTGIGRYLRCLYGTIRNDPELSRSCRIFFFDGMKVLRSVPEPWNSGRSARLIEALWKLPDVSVLALRAFQWLIYERRLRSLCRSGRFDLYHGATFSPAALDAIPTVHNIFDLSLERYAHPHPRERVWFYKLFFRRRLRYVTHILTISQFVKHEIVVRLRVPAQRVSTVPLAPHPVFFPRSPRAVEELRRHLGLGGPYLFSWVLWSRERIFPHF